MTVGPVERVTTRPPEDLVRRLYWRRWAPRAAARGLDPEEVYQQVWLAILSPRRAPYDPRRGALATWLYCLMRTTVSNAADGHRRAAWRWTVGETADAALSAGHGCADEE